jgi:hypothetical protein
MTATPQQHSSCRRIGACSHSCVSWQAAVPHPVHRAWSACRYRVHMDLSGSAAGADAGRRDGAWSLVDEATPLCARVVLCYRIYGRRSAVCCVKRDATLQGK